jgi:hypothetical protein
VLSLTKNRQTGHVVLREFKQNEREETCHFSGDVLDEQFDNAAKVYAYGYYDYIVYRLGSLEELGELLYQ